VTNKVRSHLLTALLPSAVSAPLRTLVINSRGAKAYQIIVCPELVTLTSAVDVNQEARMARFSSLRHSLERL
jgi:hypothetical protein